VLSTVRIEDRGLPAVAVVTASFADLAERMRDHNDHPNLHVLVLPYPLEDQPEERVRRVAREFYPQLLGLLGATPATGSPGPAEPMG
jgi:hypothetical protein